MSAASAEVPPEVDGGLRNDGVESASDGVGGDGSTDCGEMSGDVPPDGNEDVVIDGMSSDVVLRVIRKAWRSFFPVAIFLARIWSGVMIDGMSSDVVPPDSENDGIDS